MTDFRPLEDIQGKQMVQVDAADLFKGFVIDKILLEYDFPRILSACAPNETYWLFKWCDSEEEREASGTTLELWLAFKLSKARLESVKQGTTSLREALSLAKGDLYLYTCEQLFVPLQMKSVNYESIPKEYLPRNDISLKDGTIMEISGREPQQLGLRLHMLSDEYISMSHVKLSDHFQQFLSCAAHNVALDTPRLNYLPEDWSVLSVTNVSLGSYNLECTSRNREKARFLAHACELLSALISDQKTVHEAQKEVGNDALMHLHALANFVSEFDLSVSVKWTTEEKSNGYLAIDKRRADRILEAMKAIESMIRVSETELTSNGPRRVIIEYNEAKPRPLDSVTLELNQAETDAIRKIVRGEGGMQSLIRELQSKLKEDNVITLDPLEVDKILRYAFRYGQGGFQGRLSGIARALKRVGIGLNEI